MVTREHRRNDGILKWPHSPTETVDDMVLEARDEADRSCSQFQFDLINGRGPHGLSFHREKL